MSVLPKLSSMQLALLSARLHGHSGEAAALAREPIAIVALAARLPVGDAGVAEDLEGFWQLLAAGRDAVGAVPAARRDLLGDMADLRGSFLREVHEFDAPLFRLSRREACALDPQQRLLLELSWEALERGAIAPDRLRDRATVDRIGVYVGIGSADYAQMPLADRDFDKLDHLFGTGNAPAFAAGRLAYHLGTSGPAMTIETACSSSLTALHLACRALRGGECAQAIVAGVHLILAPFARRYFQRLGALARDGRSKSFGGGADGFGSGEGGVACVLMPLSQAVRQGHHIHALIRGSALSQDGASGGGLTVPSIDAQRQVIEAALADAGLDADEIDYVETHGTGTELGDPIEIAALRAVFNTGRREAALRIGAVKANIGHTEAAAGLCGLTKLILALQKQSLPPQPALAALNPHVDWDEGAPSLVRQAAPWPRGQRPRRAGLSAFGLSGTNAHIVIEEAPLLQNIAEAAPRSRHVYTLSARDSEQLAELARRGAADIAAQPEPRLADVCYAANVGRARHRISAAVHGASHGELREGLLALAARPPLESPPENHGVVFLLTGQGNPSPGAGATLYREQPDFRAAITRCARLLGDVLPMPLPQLLFDPSNAKLWRQTRYAQPAMVALSWSLAQLWAAWGVQPQALHGHSLGEYTAAALAGMASIEDILPLVAARGELMQRLPPGRMVVVASPAEALAGLIAEQPDRLALAAANAPRSCVIAGDIEAIELAERELERRRLRYQRLETEQAFHSPHMEPLLDALRVLAGRVAWQAPRTPMIANLDGGWHERAPDADYWARHARQPVCFRQGMATLFAQPSTCFLELGARPVLSLLGQAHETAPAGGSWCCSLHGDDDWAALLESVTVLHRGGIALDWQAFERPHRRRRIAQSPSPFARAAYRLERPVAALATIETSHSSNVAGRTSEPVQPPPDQAATIHHELRAQVALALGEPEHAVAGDRPFVEMGADSVVLAEAMREIQLRYGVKLGIQQLLGELNTLDRLAAFLARHAPALPANSPTLPAANPQPAGAPATTTSTDDLFARQLALVKSVIDAQLASLAGTATATAATAPAAVPTAPTIAPITPAAAPANVGKTSASPRQLAHFAEFSRSYIARTAQSKQLADNRRGRLADVRAAAGFRPSMKELIYPITGDRAEGARLWDVDGNEYIDISMDFGVNLFGHGAPFLRRAAAAQLERGLALGPRSSLAGDCAELICGLSGMDRVLFCQSGSESVMTAVRLAKLHRGRDKIVVFRKSYHGHFDGFLGDRYAPGASTEPVAPGISQRFVEDLLVLDYASEASLHEIARHADGLAAVLVEPVQSRNVDLQPREFLQRLRELTSRLGILLIFDEMITGFRSAPGGAQELFGVAADLVTYGKTIGGGVPMAALAARGRLLDGIDGGVWRFGDRSAPNPQVTFFAGTFNNHPLGLSLCHAVLTELKSRGPDFQRSLNERTANLSDRLNQHFAAIDAPLRIIRFGSMFRFKHAGNLDLLYHHLLYRGIFVWEGRNCFLCDAHGEAEIEAIIERTSDAVQALRHGGYLAPSHGSKASTPIAPAAVVQQRPLSDQQKQIWIAAQLDAAGAPAYVETLSFELDGVLDAHRLRFALDQLSERHEALRTTIDGENDRQTVHASLPTKLWEAAAQTPQPWLADFHAGAFSLEHEAPLQVGLLRLSSNRSVLAIRAHHALIDGLSLSVLLDELSTLLRDPAAILPTAVPFSAHLDAVARLDRDEAEAFWHAQIAGAPAPLPLSALRQGTQNRWRGERVRQMLPAELGPALSQWAARSGCTVFVAALTATLGLLHALYDRDDVLIGVAAHGRRDDHQRMVGQAAQLLPWRSRLSPGMRLEQLLEAVNTQWQAIGEYQRLPLSRLLGPLLGDTQGPGAINLVFNIDRAPHRDFAGLAAQILDTPVTATKFELSINLIQARQAWLLDLDYSSARYSREQIERFGERWIAWVGRAVSEPGLSLQKVVALPDAELAQVRDAFASSGAVVSRHPPSMIELFQRQLADRPSALAIRDGGREFDYAALDRAARALARRLLDRGASSEHMVGLMLPRSAELVAATLGVFYAGAVILPLSLDDPAARRARIFEVARPLAIVTLDPIEAAQLPGEPMILAIEWPSTTDARESELIPAQPVTDQLAYVIHTSGSSGQPKGAECGHRGLARFIACFTERYGLNQTDRVLMTAPPTFDASIMEICLPLALGGCIVVAAPDQHRDPQYLARLMARERVSFAFLVPAMLDLLARQAEFSRCDSLRHLLVGGDVLHADVRDAVLALDLHLQLHNVYGPTETTIIVSGHRCMRGVDEPPIPIGRAHPGNYFRIVDSQLRPVGIGVEGELLIGGEQVGHGYLDDAELSASRFIADPLDAQAGPVYRSGDRACWREDGEVLFRGRADRLLKLRGQRLELGEIEAALRSHPRLVEAVAEVIQQDQQQRLIAWYVPAEDASHALSWRDELRDYLAGRLPPYMLPAEYIPLCQLPLNANGKIDRLALPLPPARAAQVLEASPLQRRLLDYLATGLALPIADLQENFFAAGGQSLAAAKLVSWVRQEWRIELSLKQFLQRPTIAGLADAIERAHHAAHSAGTDTIPIRSRERRRVKRKDALEQALAIETQAALDNDEVCS